MVTVEHLILPGPGPTIEVDLLLGAREAPRPVILMPGALDAVPAWAEGLVSDGFGLAAFRARRDPDPDPARRPTWLHFDERFAHSYVEMGLHTPADAARVMDHLGTRPDVQADRFGWMGSSSSGIPGLAVAVQEPRLAAILAFVATGAYRSWLTSWRTHDLWRGEGELWPETEQILREHDPVDRVSGLYPTAVLLVSGGADVVVDPATTEEFVAAARPYYAADPDRLRHVVYQGFSHNLPRDVVRLYAEHWFRLYLHPDQAAPVTPAAPATLGESVVATQINAADHRDIVLPQPQK